MSTKMWKVDYGKPTPLEVTTEEPCWPNEDSNGDTIFENTHFLDEEEAWEKHKQEHEAGLKNAVSRVNYSRKDLERVEKDAVEAAVFLAAVLEAGENR